MKLRNFPGRRLGVFRSAAAGVMAAVAASAAAHHSFAMFDPQHPVTLEGTVESWEFTNPHSWLVLLIMKGDTQIGRAHV